MEAIKVDFSDLVKVMEPLLKLVKDRENEWRLTIWHELDGFVLEGMCDGIVRKWVIEIDPVDPLESYMRLLYEVMNYFAFQGSKHDPERIILKREKRDDG